MNGNVGEVEDGVEWIVDDLDIVHLMSVGWVDQNDELQDNVKEKQKMRGSCVEELIIT